MVFKVSSGHESAQQPSTGQGFADILCADTLVTEAVADGDTRAATVRHPKLVTSRI